MKKSLMILIVALALPASASNTYQELVGKDLIQLQSSTSYYNNSIEIQEQNQRTLDQLAAFEPKRTVIHSDGRQRLNSLSFEWAQKAMRSIDRHPVVSSFQYSKYNNKGVEIGFCFGRATYAHLALLKMGVNKDAIKKVWVVGPMRAGSINWAFHVGTIVKADEPGKWWVVDNYPGQLLEIRDWFSYMAKSSMDNELKIYITEPHKFSVSLGPYSRVQLGLGLTREQDWYSHYFADLLSWFRDEKLETVGLKDLRD